MNVEQRKLLAMEIARSINPEAQLSYTTGLFGKKLCNGLYLDECRTLCVAAYEEFVREGNKEAARAIHEVPLFVFAMLSKEEIKEFVAVWMTKRVKEG